MPQLKGAAFWPAAGPEKLGKIDRYRLEASRGDLRGQPGRLRGQHYVKTVTDRVQAQYLGIGVLRLDELGELAR
jgi:hypothetical protein